MTASVTTSVDSSVTAAETSKRLALEVSGFSGAFPSLVVGASQSLVPAETSMRLALEVSGFSRWMPVSRKCRKNWSSWPLDPM